MALLPSLPETAHLADLFRQYPDHVGPLLQFADGVLRSEGELGIGERELIAAYVSGLNACSFCMDSHRIYAQAFGIEDGVIDALVSDIDSAPVDDRLKPILHYVRKLNSLPGKLVRADADAVFEAGWSEKALVCAIEVCGLFNLFNRLVEGAGVDFDYAKHPESHPVSNPDPDRLAHSYLDFGRRLNVIGS